MRIILSSVATLLVGVLGLVSVPGTALADDILCESDRGRENTCRADTRDGVILLTQLSGAGCYEDSTWGYDSREIWVSNGCRAVFRTGETDYRSHVRDHGRIDSDDDDGRAAGVAVGVALALGAAAAIHNAREDEDYDDDYRHHDYSRYRSRTTEVTCESIDDRYRECRADVGRNGSVHMTRRLSSSGCRFDRDWGFDRNSIWVDNGCRARFEIE